MPTSNKLLFTLYTEKEVFREIIESKPFILEYMYILTNRKRLSASTI